ncbi:MAG: hypothetical protein M3Y27_06075 [Acidobacteriota bacterium]|nr:hypothetical protein [Acidobacteriota bacterium]
MKLTIELNREVDGRWIAEVPELNVLLYGESGLDANGELPPDAGQPSVPRSRATAHKR